MLTVAEKWYKSNEMVSEPPKPCEFKVGDVVKFTNDNGVKFGPHKVLGYTTPENELNGRFIHIDYDCVWFPTSPESLKKIPSKGHSMEKSLPVTKENLLLWAENTVKENPLRNEEYVEDREVKCQKVPTTVQYVLATAVSNNLRFQLNFDDKDDLVADLWRVLSEGLKDTPIMQKSVDQLLDDLVDAIYNEALAIAEPVETMDDFLDSRFVGW